MSERITENDLAGMLGRVRRSAESAGVDSARWALTYGSATYGRSFRLVEIMRPGTGERDVVRLGMTKAEAYHSLHMLTVAFEMVH